MEEYNKAKGKQYKGCLGQERFFAAFLLRVIVMNDGVCKNCFNR